MKGKINKDGGLEIYRVNKFKQQKCFQGEGNSKCGDWCPAFGTPRTAPQLDPNQDFFSADELNNSGVTFLHFSCGFSNLEFTQWEDERN